MRRAHRIFAVIFGVIGVALVVRSALLGPWPVSVQMVAGVLLVSMAILRWRYS